MPLELNEAKKVRSGPSRPDDDAVRAFLRDDPDWLRGDPALLSELGLRLDAANIIDFGPIALSKVSEAHRRESGERRRLEAIAQANFAAQVQTHAAVVDVLDASSLEDLSRRVDTLARRRFGLAAGVIALEGGAAPGGWVALVEGQVDLILGESPPARIGRIPTALGLFGSEGPAIGSVAIARLDMWDPARAGVIAFGASDPSAFSPDMGAELVVFLARVVERTAERWPRP